MDGNHVVVDISSDEDVGFDWPATDGCDSDIDWNELFVNLEKDASDSQNRDKGYDSDEVVVIKEVFANPNRTTKFSGVANFAARHREEEDDDDDCVILDGDPDKPVAQVDNSGYDSDDLVIVSEKGQVACRDYPHPRHLCVKFPFASTLHSERCGLCHCYVCDSPAPCGYWGKGNSETDHCHATEKEELWTSMRKKTKQVGNPNPPIVSFTNRSFLNDLLYPVPAPNPRTLNFDPPNIIRTGRYSSNQLSHPQQPIIPCSNYHKKARVISSISSHSVTSSPILKRPRPSEMADDSFSIICDYISAGPTPSQGQATQAQLYAQRTSRAIGNLTENISAPVNSNARAQQN